MVCTRHCSESVRRRVFENFGRRLMQRKLKLVQINGIKEVFEIFEGGFVRIDLRVKEIVGMLITLCQVSRSVFSATVQNLHVASAASSRV